MWNDPLKFVRFACGRDWKFSLNLPANDGLLCGLAHLNLPCADYTHHLSSQSQPSSNKHLTT